MNGRDRLLFLDWLRGQVPAEDRPARPREITLTTARWMLELYPPWIVSIARGTFGLHDRCDGKEAD